MTQLHVNGSGMNYQVTGQGDPILFIHGLGSSMGDWQYQVEYFSSRYRVVVFDLRGHGKSDKPPGPYSISLFASDTAQLIDALDIAPAHVVGLSLGGMIALQLAVDRPELIRKLVVVNSGSEMIVRTLKDRMKVWQRFLIVRLLGMRRMGEVLGKRMFPKPEQEDLRELFVDRWAENDPRAYQEAMKAIIGWSVTEQLEQITCPTLVIAAEYDYTPLEVKQSLASKIKQAQLVVIKDSRHGTPVDQPERFNEVLGDFIGA